MIKWMMFLLIASALTANCFAQHAIRSDAQSSMSASQWAWTTELWTGDDQPYEQIRVDIDKAFAEERLTPASIEEYWTQREKQPNNPQMLFQWVYACNQAQQAHPPIHLKQFPGPGAFAYVPSPHAYQYTRLRFLVNAQYGSHNQLLNVGKRLLAHHPNDYDVEYELVDCFNPSQSVAGKQQATLYAKDLIRRHPEKPSVYAALGGVYFASWLAKRNREDGKKAITAYEEYLRLAPANYEWRKQAEKIIRLIQSHQEL